LPKDARAALCRFILVVNGFVFRRVWTSRGSLLIFLIVFPMDRDPYFGLHKLSIDTDNFDLPMHIYFKLPLGSEKSEHTLDLLLVNPVIVALLASTA
jgi:hypothetical protein